MFKPRLVLVAVVLSFSFASPSSACVKWPWQSIIAWTVSAASAGFTAMFVVLQKQSNEAYAATFSPSTLIVTGYESANQPCRRCTRSNCPYYPWWATYTASYKASVGNQTVVFNTDGLSMMYADLVATYSCGTSKQDAINNIAGHIGVGTSWTMWYQNANPSTWTFLVDSPTGAWLVGVVFCACAFAGTAIWGGCAFCTGYPQAS